MCGVDGATATRDLVPSIRVGVHGCYVGQMRPRGLEWFRVVRRAVLVLAICTSCDGISSAASPESATRLGTAGGERRTGPRGPVARFTFAWPKSTVEIVQTRHYRNPRRGEDSVLVLTWNWTVDPSAEGTRIENGELAVDSASGQFGGVPRVDIPRDMVADVKIAPNGELASVTDASWMRRSIATMDAARRSHGAPVSEFSENLLAAVQRDAALEHYIEMAWANIVGNLNDAELAIGRIYTTTAPDSFPIGDQSFEFEVVRETTLSADVPCGPAGEPICVRMQSIARPADPAAAVEELARLLSHLNGKRTDEVASAEFDYRRERTLVCDPSTLRPFVSRQIRTVRLSTGSNEVAETFETAETSYVWVRR